MSEMFNRALNLYRAPDVDKVDSDTHSVQATRRIVGGKSDFTKVYSGVRTRNKDFRRFYAMLTGKNDMCDSRIASGDLGIEEEE